MSKIECRKCQSTHVRLRKYKKRDKKGKQRVVPTYYCLECKHYWSKDVTYRKSGFPMSNTECPKCKTLMQIRERTGFTEPGVVQKILFCSNCSHKELLNRKRQKVNWPVSEELCPACKKEYLLLKPHKQRKSRVCPSCKHVEYIYTQVNMTEKTSEKYRDEVMAGNYLLIYNLVFKMVRSYKKEYPEILYAPDYKQELYMASWEHRHSDDPIGHTYRQIRRYLHHEEKFLKRFVMSDEFFRYREVRPSKQK